MKRILAIDYGKKRTGLAITDSQNIIASGLCTVHTKELMTFLENLILKEQIGIIVIGEPKHLDNTPAQFAAETDKFTKMVSNKFPDLKIERMDERFTSKMAFQTMIDSGLKKSDRRNKALVDEISATIILQSYLETISK